METTSLEPDSNGVEKLPKQSVSKLLLPPRNLSNCIFGAFVRDTRGCGLNYAQRFNYFPASPLCCVSWIFDGDCHVIDPALGTSDPARTAKVPRLFITGPLKNPQASWNPGDTNAMTIAFYPEAFFALTGIPIENIADQYIPADDLLSDNFLELVTTVLEKGNAEAGFKTVMEALAPQWKSKRPNSASFGPLVSDWVTSIATQAMISSAGQSVRQIERRFKLWTGRSQRTINAYARTDLTYQEVLAAKARGPLDLADLSAQTGFADQSHMTRHVRRQTGFSPADLMKRIETEEAFWSFRLLGERY